jgi:hypothetical protein
VILFDLRDLHGDTKEACTYNSTLFLILLFSRAKRPKSLKVAIKIDFAKMLRLSSRIIQRRLPQSTRGFSSFNDDQIQLRDLAAKFTAAEITPAAAHHDRTGEYPTAILKKLFDVGLLNLHIPEANGGAGMGVLECAIVSEELAYGCTGIQTAAEGLFN